MAEYSPKFLTNFFPLKWKLCQFNSMSGKCKAEWKLLLIFLNKIESLVTNKQIHIRIFSSGNKIWLSIHQKFLTNFFPLERKLCRFNSMSGKRETEWKLLFEFFRIKSNRRSLTNRFRSESLVQVTKSGRVFTKNSYELLTIEIILRIYCL
jgi:hypothetical protein